MRNTLFIAFFLFIAIQSIFGQFSQENKIEFEEIDNLEVEREIIPLKENGVLLLQNSHNLNNGKNKIEFYKYDTNLQLLWNFELEPEKRLPLKKFFQNDQYLYLFFQEEDKADFGILRLDLESGDKHYTDGHLLTQMSIDHFVVLQNRAFLGGEFNEKPVVLLFSFFDKSFKVLPEIHNNHLIINKLQTNSDDNTLFLLLKNEKNCRLLIKNYSYEGKLLTSYEIGKKSSNPMSGQLLNIDKTHLAFVGSYAEACASYALGFYWFDLPKADSVKYINFAELSNFFSYLNLKKEEKVKVRLAEKKQKGREIKLPYHLLLHPIQPAEDGNYLIAEVFFPEYKAPNNTLFTTWNNQRIGNYYYNHFRYSHAIICKFSKTGELVWNNSVSLKNVQSDELNQKIQLSQFGEKFIIAYPNGSVIRTAELKPNERISDLSMYDIKSSIDSNKITDMEDPNLLAWYKQSYLVYGYQKVKTINSLEKRVFYLSKINYQLK